MTAFLLNVAVVRPVVIWGRLELVSRRRFCPPVSIARKHSYCIFLDELNACSQDVQKANYRLIHEKRIGDYTLPVGSVVIGTGNRSQDNAIVKPMSSALIDRMIMSI